MGSLANAYGADKSSVLNGWVHPADRGKAEYREQWAAYCAHISAAYEAAERADSVRCKVASDSQAEQAPVKLNAADSQAEQTEHVPPVVTPFAGWLAGSGLTVRAVALRCGVSPGTVHNWKAKGAPAEVMSKLEG